MPRDNAQECGAQGVVTGVTLQCHRTKGHTGAHASSTYGTRWRDSGEVVAPPPFASGGSDDVQGEGLLAVAGSRRTARTTGGPAVSHVQRDYAFMDPEKVHRCCAIDCDNLTLLGYVACRRHWTSLPRSVRRDLAIAFRQREQRPELYAEAVMVAKRLINLAAAGAA